MKKQLTLKQFASAGQKAMREQRSAKEQREWRSKGGKKGAAVRWSAYRLKHGSKKK